MLLGRFRLLKKTSARKVRESVFVNCCFDIYSEVAYDKGEATMDTDMWRREKFTWENVLI